VKVPDSYLGAQVSNFYIDGADDPEKPRWAMSSEKYDVKQAVADGNGVREGRPINVCRCV
jgi:hypothetical protein